MEKVKSIETSRLVIKGNIIKWPGTMIQLSNISCISISALALRPFPFLSILLELIGIGLVKISFAAAFIVILAGLTWIFLWYKKNKEIKESTNLNIMMNSGKILQIVFKDTVFLNRVLNVLEAVIREGGVGNSNDVLINIKDCTIGGNAQVLTDLKVK